MDRLEILLIDDEDDIRDMVPTDLEAALEEEGIASQVVAVATVKEAQAELAASDYHLAVVDLRLEGAENGNQLIASILDSQILPIIVFSGYSGDLDPDFRDHGLIEVADEKKVGDLMGQIRAWSERSVFEFFSTGGFVASRLHDALLQTMWENVSMYWEHLPTEDDSSLADIATRILASLLLDDLRTREDGTGGRAVHHSEVYVFSTPRQYLAVGDLIEEAGSSWMTLTPTCDLIPRGGSAKVEDVLCARCQPLPEFMQDNEALAHQVRKANQDTPDGGAQENIAKAMRHAFGNDAGDKFFLPPFGPFEGGVVLFRQLRTFDYRESALVDRAGNRTLSLNPDLAAEMATRFSRFMSRLGQPAYDEEHLLAEFERFGNPLGE